jgi:UDP-N-acetyl-D-galactosamine dehydrogenase
MGAYVVSQMVKAMTRKRILIEGSRVLVMGLTFKENCPDLRNSRVIDIIKELREYRCEVDVFDPWISAAEAQKEYGVSPIKEPKPGSYDGIILAVAHDQFRKMGAATLRELGKPQHVLYDLKYLLPQEASDLRL